MTEPRPIPLGRPSSIFEQVGGHTTFTALVDWFYEGVDADAELIAMYPEGHDLDGAKWRLQAFLEQYFGGPTTYSEQRGHPRLRMRHMPFPVTFDARDRWLKHMRAALDRVALPPMHDELMWDYFQRAATAMVNTADGDRQPPGPLL